MSDLMLYVYPGIDGLASASPFALKTLYGLRYLKIPHEVEVVAGKLPAGTLRGRIPVARFGAKLIEDSTNILRAADTLQNRVPALYPSDPVERADTLLLEDWSDESLVLNLRWYRWYPEANFQGFASKAFGTLPGVVRAVLIPLLRRRIVRNLKRQGIGDLPDHERLERFSEQMAALDARLGVKPFLCAQTPTAADMSVFACLQHITVTQLPELAPRVLEHKRLTEWIRRMEIAVGFVGK